VFEDLSLERMEIDFVELKGPVFEGWDRTEMHAALVVDGYSEAVAFTADGSLVPPTEILYKKALVLAPGAFEQAGELHGQLIQTTLAQVPKEEIEQSKGSLGMFCLSSQPISAGSVAPTADDVVRSVRNLRKLGYGTLFFRAKELYTMSEYVSRYTNCRVYFAVGLSVMIHALQDRYRNLAGALLEGVARLFSQNVRLGVYPMAEEALRARLEELGAARWKYRVTNGLVYADDLQPEEPVNSLFRYLLGCKFIVSARPAGK
jgi:hypothetical protein